MMILNICGFGNGIPQAYAATPAGRGSTAGGAAEG